MNNKKRVQPKLIFYFGNGMWKVLIPMVLMKQKPNGFFSVNALLENSQNSSSGKANKIIEHGFMSIFRLTMEKIKDLSKINPHAR